MDPFNPKQTMRRVQERPPKSEEKVNTPTDFDEVEEFEVKEFYKLWDIYIFQSLCLVVIQNLPHDIIMHVISRVNICSNCFRISRFLLFGDYNEPQLCEVVVFYISCQNTRRITCLISSFWEVIIIETSIQSAVHDSLTTTSKKNMFIQE